MPVSETQRRNRGGWGFTTIRSSKSTTGEKKELFENYRLLDVYESYSCQKEEIYLSRVDTEVKVNGFDKKDRPTPNQKIFTFMDLS